MFQWEPREPSGINATLISYLSEVWYPPETPRRSSCIAAGQMVLAVQPVALVAELVPQMFSLLLTVMELGAVRK